MVKAYHCIFSAYGFWLPNDPRGSWSDWIRSWELLRFGCATKTSARHSLAHDPHNAAKRRAAKQALKHPPVVFTGVQARAIARGFRRACETSGYIINACAIMPDHVHLVIARHCGCMVEQIVRHLKGFATMQFNREGIHPLKAFANKSETPSPWAQGTGWKVFLNTPDDIDRSIAYVENNPPREGLREQRWSFVTRSETV